MASLGGGGAGGAPCCRVASHAGSWYARSGDMLGQQLKGWLADARQEAGTLAPAKAIIAPHAGYSYSGRAAAYAYRSVQPDNLRRIFVLGPSHRFYLEGCALSAMTQLETPLGPLAVDTDVVALLAASGMFMHITATQDEEEHSIEMHLPYLAHIVGQRAVSIVPIMVGAMKDEQRLAYAQLLKPYFDDPYSLFVISSDFCHWGSRFRFQFWDKSAGPIHESIRALDYMAIALIEAQDTHGFLRYLRETKNTICGRNPITLLLEILDLAEGSHAVAFQRYEQSSQCKTMQDSSVSYASATVTCVA